MDVEISVSNRQIKPYKIAVKQFESGTTMLKFNMDGCKIDQIDLRNYKAYVETSINGMVDMTELVMDTSGTTMTLTWVLSERTLRYACAINYQIVFKDVNEDGDGSAVYSTYQAVIQCSESVDAERTIAADYPTVLKQQFDLIRTLSGAFGAEIVYMPIGGSIPIEERLDGRLYYQWLDVPTTRAVCATGSVSLGDHPYADSGLYINGKHIFVDNTSEPAYAIEASTWVNAINNAKCGVTATDISGSDGITLMLVADTAGTSGNDITLKLDVALYGEAAGTSNPSGGHVSGSTLVGGVDAITGSESPIGQFEDAHGNLLCKLITDEQINGKVDKDSSWGMPDYTKPVGLVVGTQTVAVDSIGYVRLFSRSYESLTVQVAGLVVYQTTQPATSGDMLYDSGYFLIPAGSTVRIIATNIDDGFEVGYYCPLMKS